MIKKLLFCILLSGFTMAYADTIKTDVVVVGGSASGVAAALQCARSKVKTILVEPGPWLGGEMTSGGMCILEGNRNLPSGIWCEFRKQVREYYKKTPGFDTTLNAPLRFEPYTGAAILRKMTDTVKNLTLKLKTPWTSVKKNGTGWELSITENGKTNVIKAQVLIDATETGDVATQAGVQFVSGFDSRQDTGEQLAPEKAINEIQDITWCAIVKDYGAAADRTIVRPAGYQAERYACLKGKDLLRMVKGGRLPNDKYLIKWSECANSFTSGLDSLNLKHREQYYKEMRLRTLGLIYYLQTAGGLKNFGLTDEFSTPDQLPSIPYMREYRRAKGMVRMVLDDILNPYDRSSKLYRTSIAVGDASPGQHYVAGNGPKTSYPPFPAYSIPLGAVVVKDFDNLLVTEKSLSVSHLVNASTFYPSVQMVLGQGAGAVAAYLSFFKTTTKNLKVRVIQGELLDFKGYLIPFCDIPQSANAFRAIQQVGATGLLRGVVHTDGKTASVWFKPDSTVSTNEIKPVLTEIYTHAFLWFNKEKPAEQFTIGNMLSLISDVTLSDPKPLQMNMAKQWQSVYKFNQAFDLKRPITRLEFAILANKFLNPFARTVDLSGRLIN
ncbi:FAD-dependent oxidoreductase [Mucilaginibacter sp. Bleaf8]|uniref:FAD-dependent oxidoreductase n=1 Tax=Mucilaginibacter sp. Bleaf8 TaxID=2834430 RepID=UPI001BCE7448|nr:FAD-dependent oxidoreductase [Mucilaginibacter sp. Bleaf8]MBS7566916.1 FAD-dependent oxidoreductase [Mucilaginibacter sp. Bleaf8]